MPTKTHVRRPRRSQAVPPSTTVQVIQIGGRSKLRLRDQLDMTREVFSRVVNVSLRTIAKVEQDQSEVVKLQRPYVEVARLVEALGDVVDAEAIGPWFVTPNPAFDGMKPIELIERGEIDRLWDMVHRLQYGMPG